MTGATLWIDPTHPTYGDFLSIKLELPSGNLSFDKDFPIPDIQEEIDIILEYVNDYQPSVIMVEVGAFMYLLHRLREELKEEVARGLSIVGCRITRDQWPRLWNTDQDDRILNK